MFSSCHKEDKLSPQIEIEPQYVLPHGTNATALDNAIYDFYQTYNTYVVYDYPEKEYKWVWTSPLSLTIYPVEEENLPTYGSGLMDLIDEKWLSLYPEDFLREALPYQILLTQGNSTNDTSYVTANKVNYMAVGMKMDKWNALDTDPNIKLMFQRQVMTIFATSYYSKIPHSSEYEAVNAADYGQIIPNSGTKETTRNIAMYTLGLFYRKTTMGPTVDEDFGACTAFIATNSWTRINYVFNTFPATKTKALFMIRHCRDVLGWDIVQMQNDNFPDDKMDPIN